MISGGTETQRITTAKYYEFYVKELKLPPHLNITVDIHLGVDDEYGNCYQLNDTTYEINLFGLRYYGFNKVLQTLAHELTHVKQFVEKTPLSEEQARDNEILLYERLTETLSCDNLHI